MGLVVHFLGSMLPQYMALSVSFVSQTKICVSVRWVTLWVRPPPVSCASCIIHIASVMTYDAMTYDIVTYDVMTYYIMTYDIMTYMT